jgi:hypothetical protein
MSNISARVVVRILKAVCGCQLTGDTDLTEWCAVCSEEYAKTGKVTFKPINQPVAAAVEVSP